MPDGLSFTPINDISDLVIRDKKVQQLKDFDFNVFRCATPSLGRVSNFDTFLIIANIYFLSSKLRSIAQL